MTDLTPAPTETLVEALEIKAEDETKIVLFRLEEKTIAELKKVFNIFNSFVDEEIKALCNEIKTVIGE